MNAPRDAENVVVSTVVAVAPGEAFAIFTEDVDLWWRRGPRYRAPGDDRLRFEPGPTGRLVAESSSGEMREIGEVVVWEPDAGRLVFRFRAPNFAPNEETEVDVRFEPVVDGTRVTLEHRGLGALRPDHPARHGLEGTALVALYGTWWGDMLVELRGRANVDRPSRAGPARTA